MEILTWLEANYDLLVRLGKSSSSNCCAADQQLLSPPPSCQQLVWSSPARVPLDQLRNKSLLLPSAITEHAQDDHSLTSIEIHNSYCPSTPVCVGEFCSYSTLHWRLQNFQGIQSHKQCCGSGSRSGSARIRNFLQDPDPDQYR
jgi:hypothetical protein